MTKLSLSEILGGFKDLVTRFEVIDETGRAYVRKGVSVEVSYQDCGKTLKVFVKERPKVSGEDRRLGSVKTRSQIKNPLTGTWTTVDKVAMRAAGFVDVKTGKPFKGVRKTRGR